MTIPPEKPEPLPRDLDPVMAEPGKPDAMRCHYCNGHRSLRHGVLLCRICDAPPLTKE